MRWCRWVHGSASGEVRWVRGVLRRLAAADAGLANREGVWRCTIVTRPRRRRTAGKTWCVVRESRAVVAIWGLGTSLAELYVLDCPGSPLNVSKENRERVTEMDMMDRGLRLY